MKSVSNEKKQAVDFFVREKALEASLGWKIYDEEAGDKFHCIKVN
jgi:hypothetical protein